MVWDECVTNSRQMGVIGVLLLSLVAMATGIIPDNNASNSTTPGVVTLMKSGRRESCQLHNPVEGVPLSINSSMLVPMVTVIFKEFASVDCTAINFCRITWIKNTNESLPIGHFMSLSNDNQTLEIKRAYHDRAGNYTCTAVNGNQSVNRTVQVFVQGRPWTRPPIALHEEACVNQTANEGATAKFFCLFYAGEKVQSVNLTWFKQTEPGIWCPVTELDSEGTKYEEEMDYTQYGNYIGDKLQQAAGSHLTISQVTAEAFGDYRLKATTEYGVDYTQTLSLAAAPLPPKPDYSRVIAASVSVAFVGILMISLAVTRHFFKLDFSIWRKNRFGDLEDDDGMDYDAFISYADDDLEFAMMIRESLKLSGYAACLRDIDIMPATTLVEEIILAMRTSRRCLIIISPNFIRARHSALQVDFATDQVLHGQSKILPIVYQDVPAADRDEIPLLKHILTNVKTVTWDRNNAERFKKQLLVQMPPLRPTLPTSSGDEADDRNLMIRRFVSTDA